MSSNGNMAYQLRHLPAVEKQIKDLGKWAAAQGKKSELVSALTQITAKLQNEPTQWGDPEYNLNKPGGCVYHGILEPLIATFAVFEEERIVLLMSIRLLPTQPQ